MQRMVKKFNYDFEQIKKNKILSIQQEEKHKLKQDFLEALKKKKAKELKDKNLATLEKIRQKSEQRKEMEAKRLEELQN